jgi:hypothetical protein
MVQLSLNQGAQDALLYDNTRSYFTNVGYVRTSNFQIEYRDVDAQNQAQLGTTVQYVIPKAADLLGPVDLVCELAAQKDRNSTAATAANNMVAWAAWVDEVGFAMIEKITFSVGSNDIETLTGEQLQIMNELMKSDEQRLGANHVLKTGQIPMSDPSTGALKTDAVTGDAALKAMLGISKTTDTASFCAIRNLKADGTAMDAASDPVDFGEEYTEYSRLIRVAHNDYNKGNVATKGKTIYLGRKKLIIPLGLFFTRHPSQYFPLAAVAGCNDVRISIKFRSKENLIQMFQKGSVAAFNSMPQFDDGCFVGSSAKLRCHYVHVTGPEATILMNKEHVRLLKLWHTPNQKIINGTEIKAANTTSFDLSFLHPITTLIITLRRNEEIDNTSSSSGDDNAAYDTKTNMEDSACKGYFNYHGDGRAPRLGKPDVHCQLEKISLTINGQERHPSLADGIDTYYLRNRLMPMLHSNTSDTEKTKLFLQ